MSDVLLIENPIDMIEGETVGYAVEWQGASSLSSPSVTCYKDGSTYAAGISSGSDSVSGNVQTLKNFTPVAGTDGGKKLVMIIQCSVDGNTERRKLTVNVQKQNTAT